ncbi:MAG: glycerophosphodiester phosphodiesterase [Clostridia bacterium]|nr:glycerophosphodiester phosphodiesterase [Clostridia bacterium]
MKKKKTIKIILSVSLTVAVLAAAIGVYSHKTAIEKYKNEISLPNNFTLTAHTGCMNTKENSLDSIAEGAKFCEIVEFDLHFNKNLTAVLAHDEPSGNEVTLDEAFSFVSEIKDISVNVDIKSTANLSEIEKTADKYSLENRFFLTGVNEAFLGEVKKECSDVKYYLNVEVDKAKRKDKEYLLSLVEKVKEAGAIGINFNKKSASKELVEIFHENGLLVSIWTVNSEKEILKIASYGPDNITTRNPEKAGELLKEYI